MTAQKIGDGWSMQKSFDTSDAGFFAENYLSLHFVDTAKNSLQVNKYTMPYRMCKFPSHAHSICLLKVTRNQFNSGPNLATKCVNSTCTAGQFCLQSATDHMGKSCQALTLEMCTAIHGDGKKKNHAVCTLKNETFPSLCAAMVQKTGVVYAIDSTSGTAECTTNG